MYGVDLTATTKARTPKRLTASKRKRSVERARSALVLESEEVAVGQA